MNNLSSRLLLAIALLPVAADACAQVESLTPLSTRPVPQAVQALRKSEGPKTYFIYQNDPQTLPINLNAAMVSFKTNANTNSVVMERAMEARSGMPTDVTRHHDIVQQSM